MHSAATRCSFCSRAELGTATEATVVSPNEPQCVPAETTLPLSPTTTDSDDLLVNNVSTGPVAWR